MGRFDPRFNLIKEQIQDAMYILLADRQLSVNIFDYFRLGQLLSTIFRHQNPPCGPARRYVGVN